MAFNRGSRRYSDVRNGHESRFNNPHDRMQSRNEAFRENENGRNNGNGSSRGRPPLLQFTTDINPACFSGPIPLSLISTSPKIPPSLDSFMSNSITSKFSSERTVRRSSINNDSSEDERRYRRYHRDQRERDCERSRGRDRERDRSRDRTLERSLERTERDRDRPKDRDIRDEIPNNTIMVRSLSSSVTEADLRTEVTKFKLEPKDIRLIREKDTGASRGFAFVEFSLLSEAVRWKELTKSTIFIDQHRSTLHYSIPKDAVGAEKVLLNRADWDCLKCGMSNFRRRDYCFKCNSPREDFSDIHGAEGYKEISVSPSNTLLFRNLDVLTTEGRVLAMLGQLTTLPIKSLRVAKDLYTNTSRGFAFVELHSTSEATQLHDLLLSMKKNFYVDGRQVTVSYAKRPLSSMNSAASANAAVVALAAAQWSNQETDSGHTSNYYGASSSTENLHGQDSQASGVVPCMDDSSELGTVVVQGVTYNKFPMPDISTYQYDASSGYYYDASTRLYYDARSQYYYNSEKQQYLYWDNEHETYLPASSEATASLADDSAPPASISAPDVLEAENQERGKTKKEPKLDKVKIAKKIAKNMERWAKTLNQKKENAKFGIVSSPPVEPFFAVPTTNDMLKQSASADACFAILEQKVSPSERNAHLGAAAILKGNKKMPVLVAQYGDESESEGEEDTAPLDVKQNPGQNSLNESKLTDWNKLACLLCKRQFPTKEVLIKHQQLSDLHKKNLLKLSTQKGS